MMFVMLITVMILVEVVVHGHLQPRNVLATVFSAELPAERYARGFVHPGFAVPLGMLLFVKLPHSGKSNPRTTLNSRIFCTTVS